MPRSRVQKWGEGGALERGGGEFGDESVVAGAVRP